MWRVDAGDVVDRPTRRRCLAVAGEERTSLDTAAMGVEPGLELPLSVEREAVAESIWAWMGPLAELGWL